MPRKPKDTTPRKIEKSEKNRVYWEPGEEHPLDVLFEELAQLRKLIPDGLAALLTTAELTEQRLRGIMEAMQDADDPTALFAVTNEKARHAILSRFGNRKHSSHLLAVLTIRRYKRLLGRMNAIQAALDLANGLLLEEEAFQEENLAAWRDHLHQGAVSPEEGLISDEEGTSTRPPTAPVEPQELQIRPEEDGTAQGDTPEELPSDEEEKTTQDTEQNKPMETLTREELRVQGIDQPLTPLVGSVEQSRRLLREFEQRLPELRRGLATGQGWFEVFYVPKYVYKGEVVAYMKALIAWWEHKIPFIPPEIEEAVHPEVRRLVAAGADIPKRLRDEAYVRVEVGPYVKYRWTEAGRTYTVSLGLRDDYPPFPFTPAGKSS